MEWIGAPLRDAVNGESWEGWPERRVRQVATRVWGEEKTGCGQKGQFPKYQRPFRRVRESLYSVRRQVAIVVSTAGGSLPSLAASFADRVRKGVCKFALERTASGIESPSIGPRSEARADVVSRKTSGGALWSEAGRRVRCV